MILGFSHLSLTCKSREPVARTLHEAGYETAFETELPVYAPEQAFRRRASPSHRVTLMTRQSQVALELLEDAVPATQVGVGSFFVNSVGPELSVAWRHAPISAPISACAARAWPSQPEPAWRVQGIAIPCTALDRGLRFWSEGAGFPIARRENAPRPWVLLGARVASRFAPFGLLLIEEPARAERPFIDDLGWGSCTLLTSHVERTARRLEEHGATNVSAPWRIEANEKRATLCLLRGPSGEVVELLAPNARTPATV